MKLNPTFEFYDLFQFIYGYFNENLFSSQLPNCMIVITRKTKTFGYYSNERWVNKENIKTDELAINPIYFSRYPLIEMLQTMAHEMAHLWQFHFGRPSVRSYHNKEWGNKMQSIGLMPSNTGKEGGKKTGQQMMDYPIKGGAFLAVCSELVKDQRFENLWFDRTTTVKIENILVNPVSSDSILIDDPEIANFLYSTYSIDSHVYAVTSDSSKNKYQCPSCKVNVWGKRDLFLVCGDCSVEFENIF